MIHHRYFFKRPSKSKTYKYTFQNLFLFNLKPIHYQNSSNPFKSSIDNPS